MKMYRLAMIVLCCPMLVQTGLKAQPVRNYDSKGKIHKSTTDYLLISHPGQARKMAAGAIIPTLVGAGISIYNTLHERKKAFYTGVYSNSATFEKLPDTIRLQRVMLWDEKADIYTYVKEDPVAAEFDLLVHEDKDGITIALSSVSLRRSRACFKPKHRLAITIDIKLAGRDKDGSVVDLGEANIIIPMIYVRDGRFNFQSQDLKKYITKATFRPRLADYRAPVSASFKVTEVNLNKVTPNVVESILKSNGSDIVDVLKGVLGNN